MSSHLQDSPKPSSVVADWIVPYRALYTSMSDVHMRDLDVTLQADFHAGINLNLTGRVTGSMDPLVNSDLVTLAYFNTETTHLLAAKGDLLSSTGVIDTILPVGTESQVLTVRAATATGLVWDSLPLVTDADVTWTGPWAAGVGPISTRFSRVGNNVAVRFPTVTGVCTVAAAATAAAASIPVGYRPTATQTLSVVVLDNLANAAGYLCMLADGSMTFSPMTGAFAGAGTAELLYTSVSYVI